MGRINSAISGIERRLLESLDLANAQATLSSYRMATGHKINSPSDDPSAFITLSRLQSQLGNVTAALSNVNAASSIITQTQSALSGMQTQFNIIRTELMKDVSHTLTPVQRAESQDKIDAAITQINALSETSINGKTVLAGAGDFTYTGRNYSQVADVQVRSKGPASQTISGSVISTATRAELTYTGDASDLVTADATFTLTGERGNQAVSVTTGTALSDLATTINDNSYLTGITATVDTDAHTLTFTSVDYGSSAKANVAVSSGSFVVTGGDGAGNATGTNASAIINGTTVGSSSNNVSGNRFTFSNNGFSFDIEFKAGFTGTFDTISISGSNLSFDLTTEMSYKSSVTVPAMNAVDFSGPSGNLNDLMSGGSLAGLGNNTAQAIRVVDESIGKLTQVKGSVDGFYNAAITSSSELMASIQTDLGTSIDVIDKVNDAEETVKESYYQSLASNATVGLLLIDQQRQSIVNMLQQIAGLNQT